jgi:sugar phosphate isomerase/epimerase
MLSRRQFLAAASAAPLALLSGAADAATSTPPLGIVIHSYGIRSRVEREQGFSDPLRFLEFCHARGAGSVQLPLGRQDSAYCARLRQRCAELGMGLEGSIRPPADDADVPRFEAEVRTANETGASVLRTVMLGGRRYEVFQRLEDYRQFERRSRQSLDVARPIMEKHRVRLAVENHKDYRAADLAQLLRSLNSEFVGACVDTGNNIALLEDPLETAKTLAPWTLSCHLKDMGVREYAEGLLLSEVPLGAGFLDLKQIVALLRAARPELRLHLEMITRDPLRIPCLTSNYWATFPDLPARELAAALARVRQHASSEVLPHISHLSESDQLAAEDRNVATSLAYARRHLGTG